MSSSTSNQISLKSILTIAFIAGTLDGAAAVIILAKLKFGATFKYIASALFGKSAFSGGTEMIFAGIVFHYLIALSFTIFYAFLVTKLKFLSTNKVLSGILYGLFVWTVMNVIVVPLTQIPHVDFNPQRALINAVILIFCIGLPIAILIPRKRD
jgi:hypothetical protein